MTGTLRTSRHCQDAIQGRTYESAVKHAQEVLIGSLEALQKNGEEIPVEPPSAPESLGLVVELPTAV
jgi:predicted RNase H-like HicB family nuclease